MRGGCLENYSPNWRGWGGGDDQIKNIWTVSGATSLNASQEPFPVVCRNRQWSCNRGYSLKVHTFPRLFILANAGVWGGRWWNSSMAGGGWGLRASRQIPVRDKFNEDVMRTTAHMYKRSMVQKTTGPTAVLLMQSLAAPPSNLQCKPTQFFFFNRSFSSATVLEKGQRSHYSQIVYGALWETSLYSSQMWEPQCMYDHRKRKMSLTLISEVSKRTQVYLLQRSRAFI